MAADQPIYMYGSTFIDDDAFKEKIGEGDGKLNLSNYAASITLEKPADLTPNWDDTDYSQILNESLLNK